MAKEYWITNSRFKYIGLLLMIIWLGFMVFFFMKAEEITKDPCLICSKKMGEEVICSTGTSIIVKRIYYPNGSIVEDIPELKRPNPYDSSGIDMDKFLNKTINKSGAD